MRLKKKFKGNPSRRLEDLKEMKWNESTARQGT
jgi:hypothetical protein